jgi:hypothetical protein
MANGSSSGASPRSLQAPYAFEICGEDYLRISVLGAGTQVVRVTGRVRDQSGEHKSFSFDLATPASRVAPATMIASIGCGWIENVTAIALSAGTGLAQAYVTVDLVRGASAAGGVMATLVAGAVSSLVRLSWPGSPLLSPLVGPGVLRTIVGTDPAAGAEISETVPAGARWLFRALRASLVTDATVANRAPVLVFDDGTNIYMTAAVNTNHAASNTIAYAFGDVSLTASFTNAAAQVSAPSNILLAGGHRIRTVTGSIQAGDNWGAPVYSVEEWLEGA